MAIERRTLDKSSSAILGGSVEDGHLHRHLMMKTVRAKNLASVPTMHAANVEEKSNDDELNAT